MRKFAAALFATLMMFLVLRWQSAGLVTSATPNGILALEFCNSFAGLDRILAAWDVHTARWAVLLDFAFILSFGLAFYYGSCAVARRVDRFRRLSRLMVYFSLLPPLLDVLENSFMLLTLSGWRSLALLQLTRFTALFKFAAAAVVVLYLLVSLLLIYGIPKKSNRFKVRRTSSPAATP